ncbi:MAG: glycosyltransferase family 1 protein [Candidatus Binatia bacterium]
MSRLRVLHWPSATGGNPPGLARAERALGLDSWSIVTRQNYFQYQADEVLLAQDESRLALEVKRWHVLWRALREFDILHFNFGQTLMPQQVVRKPEGYSAYLWRLYRLYARLVELRDLPLLHWAGKGIVVTFQGDDARQGDFCQAHFALTAATEVEAGYYSASSDQQKRGRIARIARYADCLYALNPDLLYVLPQQTQFLPYASVDPREWRPVCNSGVRSEKPIVLHAPSHRRVKGTRFVLDAVARLQNEGVPCEFILVEGLSHTEAQRLYQRADLLIDQLLIGWYGGLAVELMALGKPVICYIRHEDLKFIPAQMRRDLPIINATPTTLYGTLKEWLTTRKHELLEVGRRSRAYVETWHDPLKIAAGLKAAYEQIVASTQRRKKR